MRRWIKFAVGAGAVWTAGCGTPATETSSATPERAAPVPGKPAELNVAEPAALQPVPALSPMAETSPADPTVAARAAFQRLLVAAENGRPDDWTAAEEELKQLGADIVPALIPALEGDQPLAREMAVMFLAQLGPEAAPAAAALENVLDDPSPFVQVNAASLLTTFEDPPSAAVATLVTLVQHPENNLKITAIHALGNVPAAENGVVAAVAQCLSHEDPIVREAAASSLGRMGRGAQSAIPKLRLLLTDSDPAVKDAALFAIRQLDPAITDGDTPTINTSGQQDATPK